MLVIARNSYHEIVAYLAASFAHVWLLTGVHTRMHSQGGTLNELLTTARVVAHVGADATVNTLCVRVSENSANGNARMAYRDAPDRCDEQSPWSKSSKRKPWGAGCSSEIHRQ